LTARASQQQYRQCVNEAQQLKSQLEKKYENLFNSESFGYTCGRQQGVEVQSQNTRQNVLSVQQQDMAMQYMQAQQQEKLALLRCFVRGQELTVQQRRVVEELETLIRQSPVWNQTEWLSHFQRQLEVLQSLDMLCPRQEAEQTRMIQDLKEMICEQLSYCRQSEACRRQMETQQLQQSQVKK